MRKTNELCGTPHEAKAEFYPRGTVSLVEAESLIKLTKELDFSERMSSKMISCAAVLPRDEFIGWQMSIPLKGLTKISVFGSESICESDLRWITENQIRTRKKQPKRANMTLPDVREVYELYIPANDDVTSNSIGFETEFTDSSGKGAPMRWPAAFLSSFPGLVEALKVSGAVFRAVMTGAAEKEKEECRTRMLKTWNSSQSNPISYLGNPVRAKFLIGFAETPAVRLLSFLNDYVPGYKLRYVGNISDTKASSVWNNPAAGTAVYPDYAARIMLMEPVTYGDQVPGIELKAEPVKPECATHKNPGDKSAVMIGRALTTAGPKRAITIGGIDLARHYDIIGQTGTGKSSMICNMICDAIKKGYGLTFLDPHGTTIDMILRAVPSKYADRIRVVRIGDEEHFVPINMWSCKDPTPETEEATIANIYTMFENIFNPKNGEVFLGPRYSRWLTTFLKASLAIYGCRASFLTVEVLSANRSSIRQTADVLRELGYDELAGIVSSEYACDNSSDFVNIINWYLCKLTRLTSVPQLRNTLGAGINALDFRNTIDTDTVTLIDLASPKIGADPASILGTFILTNLWDAVKHREKREMTHLCFLDEASLFRFDPMRQILAEGRKFGIGCVLCHQSVDQLVPEVRDALESNSASFSSFRLSVKDAVKASVRLGGDEYAGKLPRLDAFNAVTSISVKGVQSAPFNLFIDKPKMQQEGECLAAVIEQLSLESLFYPYRDFRALDRKEILSILYKNAQRKQPA